MSNTNNQMGLTVWDSESDVFRYAEISANFVSIAAHNHTSGQGVQIPVSGLASTTGSGSSVVLNNSPTITSPILVGSSTNVTIASAQTTASKTITFPNVTSNANVVTTADSKSITYGMISSSGATSGQALVSDGSGNTSWQNVSGGSGGGTTSNTLSVGTTGLKLTTGTSPWNGSAQIAFDVDTSKVAMIPSLVTTLPTTGLYNGYVVDYTDNVTTPTYIWRLKYNNVTSPARWEFIGGSNLRNDVVASGGTPQTASAGTATLFPANTSASGLSSGTAASVTVPSTANTSLYRVEFYSTVAKGSASTDAGAVFISPRAGTAAAIDDNGTSVFVAGGGTVTGYASARPTSLYRTTNLSVPASTTSISLQFRQDVTGTPTSPFYIWRHGIAVRPVYITP